MLTPEVQQYINQQRSAGVPDDQIRQNLAAQGWNESDISQALDVSQGVGLNATPVAVASTGLLSGKGIIGLVVILLLLGGGGYLIFSKKARTPPQTNDSTTDQTGQNSNVIMPKPFIVATTEQASDAAKLGMVAVPSGPFIMGVMPNEPSANVWPAQVVNVKAFYIDQTEVTNEAYRQFLVNHPEWQKGQVKYDEADGRYLSDLNNNAETDLLSLPVTWVSWFAASAFCETNNKRLPTAAEWEKAARGTDGRRYPWGDKLNDSRANFCDAKCALHYREAQFTDGFAKLASVGSFPQGASPYGVLDMSGNALEWVQDWEDRSREYYKALPTSDPTGPDSGRSRVLKGGSWLYNEDFYGVRPDLYFGFLPNTTSGDVGFRCAMNAPIL